MIDQEPWQYLLDRLQSAFNPIAHELGPVKRAWAGCQFFRFGPEGEKNFLLTSPFIEQVFRKGVRRAGGLQPLIAVLRLFFSSGIPIRPVRQRKARIEEKHSIHRCAGLRSFILGHLESTVEKEKLLLERKDSNNLNRWYNGHS